MSTIAPWQSFAWGMALLLALAGPGLTAEPVDFAHQVLPILRDRCASCHTDGTYEGGLSMDTRSTLLDSGTVEPGKAAGSELIRRITAGPDERMPPEGDALSPEQITVLRRWIDARLPWQEGFSFRAKAKYTAPLAPRRPELPPPRDGRIHPIDRLLDAYFAERGAPWPEPLGDAEFLRRVKLDLVGLLPEPEELTAFVAEGSPQKRAEAIDRLLADDRAYADHWLSLFNDLLRNDYQGTGYIDGGRKPITAWLYRSLRENKPYNQFVRELLSPTAESEGFIRGIKWRGNVNASQSTELQFAQTTSQVFLGENMKCASCHDSFIDDWKLSDAWGLAAITAERPLEIYRCDKPTGNVAQPKFLFPELGDIDPQAPRGERLRQVAALMTSPENGRLTRTVVNRLWRRLMGRGLVEPVDIMANEPWSADLLDYLAADLADHGYDLKHTLRRVVTSRAYQSVSVPGREAADAAEYVFRGPEAKRMTAEQFVDAVWQITGTSPPASQAKVPLPKGATDPVRAALVPADRLQRTLGRPNREQVVTTRPGELTTLQALELTNGPEMAELVGRGAKNLLDQHPERPPEQIARRVMLAALSREPTEDERAAATEILGEPVEPDRLADLLWAVLMLPEFQVIR